MDKPPRFYFEGVDPAPSEGARSDDGACVVIRATPRNWEPPNPGEESARSVLSNNEAYWERDVIYARRIRKASARQWSGILHQHHQAFGLSRMAMDPNGGGIFIKRELASGKQLIDGADREMTPIVTLDETFGDVAHFILCMFDRGDKCLKRLWPDLKGDDVLNDVAYSSLKTALDQAQFGLPVPFPEVEPKSMIGWGEDRVWALRNLTKYRGGGLMEQLLNFYVMTNPDGTFLFTRNQARQFGCKGKKDFISAFMFANVAFLTWLRDLDEEFLNQGDGSGAMFGGWQNK